MDINLIIKDIKQSFRQMMDGATAQSMRQKGVDYHLNWGASLTILRQKADELKAEIQGTDEDFCHLAIALWKEDVRECKILATMLMPPAQFLPDLAQLWMEQTPTVEMARSPTSVASASLSTRPLLPSTAPTCRSGRLLC